MVPLFSQFSAIFLHGNCPSMRWHHFFSHMSISNALIFILILSIHFLCVIYDLFCLSLSSSSCEFWNVHCLQTPLITRQYQQQWSCNFSTKTQSCWSWNLIYTLHSFDGQRWHFIISMDNFFFFFIFFTVKRHFLIACVLPDFGSE